MRVSTAHERKRFKTHIPQFISFDSCAPVYVHTLVYLLGRLSPSLFKPVTLFSVSSTRPTESSYISMDTTSTYYSVVNCVFIRAWVRRSRTQYFQANAVVGTGKMDGQIEQNDHVLSLCLETKEIGYILQIHCSRNK